MSTHLSAYIQPEKFLKSGEFPPPPFTDLKVLSVFCPQRTDLACGCILSGHRFPLHSLKSMMRSVSMTARLYPKPLQLLLPRDVWAYPDDANAHVVTVGVADRGGESLDLV